jgi:hypothetical protein
MTPRHKDHSQLKVNRVSGAVVVKNQPHIYTGLSPGAIQIKALRAF